MELPFSVVNKANGKEWSIYGKVTSKSEEDFMTEIGLELKFSF